MKHFSVVALLVFGLAASSAVAAVDPALLGLVMPDAKVVSGIQVSQSQASPFGQYILSQMKPDGNLTKVFTVIGFDPRRDLQEIVVATVDASPQNPSGLILGRGSFQPAKIAAAAQLGGAAASTYKGFEMLGSNAGGGIVFLDGSTVAMGDFPSLKAVIDRRVAGTAFSSPLAQAARDASAANDAWFATATPSTFLAGKLPNTGNGLNPATLLQSVLQTSGGAKFAAAGITLSFEAVTNTSQDAQSLADVLRFVTSMVQMNRNSSAAGGKAASLADAASVTATGSVLRLTVVLPEQQVEQLLMPPPAKKTAAAR